MATIYMFLYTLLISTIFADSNSVLRRSDKFLKSKELQYAVPTNVCYSRNLNGNVKSMKLVCEDQICDEDATECGRKMVAYKWKSEDCDGDGKRAYSVDSFLPKDKGNYPYNCYEADELAGEIVDTAEFTTPHMVIRLRYGELVGNATNVTNLTTGEWELQQDCIARPNKTFYRSFAAITDMCHLAWHRGEEGDTPYYYRAHCNLGNETSGAPAEFLLQKFTAYNCTNTSEIIGLHDDGVTWPLYQSDGCRNEKWLDQYWYTEVIKCTHPKYNLSGVGSYNYSVSFIIFMIIYVIIN